MTPIPVASISPFGVSSGEDTPPTMFDPLATANSSRSRILIYYNEHTRGGCRISGMKAETYTASWFDPRTGAPARPDGGDWMTVVFAFTS